MKKRIFLSLIWILLLFGQTAISAQNPLDAEVQEQLDSLQLDELDSYGQENGQALGLGSFSEMAQDLASGGNPFDIRSIFNQIGKILFDEVYQSFYLLLEIIAVAILFSFLNQLKGEFQKSTVSNTAFFVCYIVLAGLVLEAFVQSADMTKNTVQSVSMFIHAAAPILMTLLIGGGAVGTAAAVNPVILMSTQVVTGLMDFLIMPLIYASAVLAIVSEINDRISISRLVELLKKAVKWSLGLIMTVFVGVLGVSGFAAASLDGAVGKTAKYLVSNSVPVVGGILSDTVETVVSCCSVVKNAVGAAGIGAVAVMCALPLLKLTVVSALFYLAAALIQTVADRRIVNAVTAVASSVGLMIAVIAVCALMFIICIGMIMSLGNTAAMLR